MRIKEKSFWKGWPSEYLFLTIGAFIVAVSFAFFIDPHNIVPGGVYGIGIAVKELTKNVMGAGVKVPFMDHRIFSDGLGVGFIGFLLNIPLTIIGIKVLGPKFGVKTVVGFVLTSFFIDFMNETIAFKLLDDTLLSCIYGALLFGLGMALIFKSKATSGGTDIVAMILAKYTRMPVGMLLIFVDSAVVLFGLIVFKEWEVPLYSFLVVFITGKVIDIAMEGISYDKALVIISDKADLIRDKLINDLERSGTIVKGTGMYNGTEKQIVYTVLNRREVVIMKSYIESIDPDAFITVTNTSEILGEGFKSLSESVKQEA